jgi:putative transposase
MEGFHQGLRLRSFDYSTPGAYFITTCTDNKSHLLSAVENGKVVLSNIGRIVEAQLIRTLDEHPLARLDCYVVMPNHVHFIFFVLEEEMEVVIERARREFEKQKAGQDLPLHPKRVARHEAASKIVPNVLREFKSKSARQAVDGGLVTGALWQRNYYDRIVRNAHELEAFRRYIDNNPIAWDSDEYNV